MLAIHSPSIISSGTANAVLSAYQISQQVHPSIFFPVKISIVPYHMICKRLYFTLSEEQQRHAQVLHHMISVDESHDVPMDHMVYIMLL